MQWHWNSQPTGQTVQSLTTVDNYYINEQISRNPRRVAHCRVSSLVMVCRRSFAAKTNLVAIETALGFDRLFLEMSTHPQSFPKV